MKVLLLIDWEYPCDHRFLESVYAKNFQDRGNEVTWVMRPSDDDQADVVYKEWKGSEVYIPPQRAYDIPKNLLYYITGDLEKNPLFNAGLEFEEYDLVHVRNDLSMGLVALHLKDRFGLPFVHQISNLKSETLIEEYKQNNKSGFAYIKGKFGMQLRSYIANSSDMVFPISEEMKRYLFDQGYSKPLKVVPTGTEIIEDVPSGKSFRERYNLPESTILLYIGSMNPVRELEFLFHVLKNIEGKDIELVMVGGRSRSNRQRLIEKAREIGVISDVTFTGWISDDDILHSAISAADVGVSPLPRNLIFETSAPIKTLEYLSFGTPVVASRIPDQDKVLTESGAGIATEYDVEAFVKAVNKVLSTDENLGKKGREYIKKRRNFETLTNRVENYYIGAIQSKTSNK